MSCSGEMLRYDIEHQLRRQLATHILTLRHEMVVHALNYGYSTYAIHCVCLSESIKYPTWEVRSQD